MWTVTRLAVASHTDVAFLYLQPYSDTARAYQEWRPAQLNLLPLQVGERITAYGYRASAIEKVVGMTVHWTHTPTKSDGKVIDVHDERRDSCMMPFPCFRTDAPFIGGMSGGPVFDADNRLRALVGTGLPPETPEGEYVSHAVILWPAMATGLGCRLDGTAVDPRYPALNLARDGTVSALHWDRITVSEPNEDGLRRVEINVPNTGGTQAPGPDEEAIRQRAYARFCERGGEHGRDFDDWLEAEREPSEGIRRR